MSTQFTNRQWRLPNNENKDKQSNYSMDFDSASSDYIDAGTAIGDLIGDNYAGSLTASLWFKRGSNTLGGLIHFTTSGWGEFTVLAYSDKIRFAINATAYYIEHNSSTGYTYDTNWHHLAVVMTPNGSVTDIKMYFDGQLLTITPVGTSPSSGNLDFAGKKLFIGTWDATNYPFNGKIDAISIFNYALSSSQVTTLYGSSSTGIGNPMSLSPKPVAYYPLGDQDAFNGANYLVPNIAAEEDDGDIAASYSPYALDFDGANDYIQTPYVLPANTTTFSISMWLNTTSFTTLQGFIGSQDSSSDGYWLSIYNNNINFKINGTTNSAPTSSLSVNTWFNLVATYDGTSVKIYLNSVNSITNSLTETINITANTIIGRLPWTPAYYFNGSMSNVSIWNTALTSAQVTEIYNEGVPSNLNNHSAYSNLVSWWQLGSNSSFNTNWTVLDEKGSNNGTSVNMDEVDIVDGVGSYANGLSSGMGGDEVIGDAPYSTANSLSVNMDVLDRSTDVPN